ncbi:diiron oxygenase [Catellatospora tritici]|uniref:diiron oxygenase n=1 Tax=Catellatospora tritici TaxID=2851566 RepID=UPI001C2D4B31|nr:diiron oxygenase [Catellatospora tritici]MBV1855899.1 diiron oxygenase [Catellatospora tritici]
MSGLATALAQVSQTADRLSRLSVGAYQNPYTLVDWPSAVDPEQDWFSTPEYVSLHGTPVWAELDDLARRRVAFHEAAGFYSLNIHGEKALIQGLAARLYRGDLAGSAGYLHHFLDEENKHSVYFGGFCTRYARVYRSRQASFGSDRPRDVDDFLFFAKTLIFEEIVDHYNRVQARDGRLHPLARFINDNHHREETRHLVFGRHLVTALWRATDWDQSTVAEIRADLSRFVTATWREFYHPDVYADAGLDQPWELAEAAWSAPAQRTHRRRVSASCLRFLAAAGVLTEEPTDAF